MVVAPNVEVRSRWRLSELEDAELARLIADGNLEERTQAREESRRRFLPLCVGIAVSNCDRLAHRARGCDRWADDDTYPFAILVLYYGDRAVGRDVEGSRRAVASMLVKWSEDPQGMSFGRWFGRGDGPGGIAEALRQWNAFRGLVQRPRPNKLKERYRDGYRELLKVAAYREAATTLMVSDVDDVMHLFDSLWWDACQTGLAEPIDVERVVRHVEQKRRRPGAVSRDDTTMGAITALLYAVDGVFATTDSVTYDEWLGRSRDLTRTTADLGPGTASPADDVGRDEW